MTVFTLACAGAAPPPPALQATPVAQPPVITRLVPDSGPAGLDAPVRIVIEGTGFADTNIVTFASVPYPGVPASERGAHITFYVPKSRPARGEAPPGPYAAGRYPITVTTAAGTSSPAMFTLTDVRE